MRTDNEQMTQIYTENVNAPRAKPIFDMKGKDNRSPRTYENTEDVDYTFESLKRAVDSFDKSIKSAREIQRQAGQLADAVQNLADLDYDNGRIE